MILLVCTEAASHLWPERRAAYERVRARVAELAGQPCELRHYGDELAGGEPRALVLSGSSAPWSAHPPGAFEPLRRVVEATEAPVLGICAGMQLLAGFAGGDVSPLGPRPAGVPAVDPAFQGDLEAEIGFRTIEVLAPGDPLFRGVETQPAVYLRHTHEVSRLPAGFDVLAAGGRCRHQAVRRAGRPVWGVQFHPEEADAAHPAGERILANFLALAR